MHIYIYIYIYKKNIYIYICHCFRGFHFRKRVPQLFAKLHRRTKSHRFLTVWSVSTSSGVLDFLVLLHLLHSFSPPPPLFNILSRVLFSSAELCSFSLSPLPATDFELLLNHENLLFFCKFFSKMLSGHTFFLPLLATDFGLEMHNKQQLSVCQSLLFVLLIVHKFDHSLYAC